LEVDTSSDGYQIKNAKIPILLALRKVADLKPHEETIPSDLDRLVALLRQNPVLRHPLVADKNTGLVLDGTHRLAAITRLGCQLAPCALIDYQDPKVRVERWFRTIQGTTLEGFTPRILSMGPKRETSSRAEKSLLSRECCASLEDVKSCLVFPARDKNPLNLARASFEIERMARDSQLGIVYDDTKTVPSSNGFVLSTVCMEKQEILEVSSRHHVFPPKTTRHIIPSRPLGLAVPLAWLKETRPDRSQEKFLKHLRAKKMIRQPEGSWVGSRRYQEEIFVFE